jgi:hypothetical protein
MHLSRIISFSHFLLFSNQTKPKRNDPSPHHTPLSRRSPPCWKLNTYLRRLSAIPHPSVTDLRSCIQTNNEMNHYFFWKTSNLCSFFCLFIFCSVNNANEVFQQPYLNPSEESSPLFLTTHHYHPTNKTFSRENSFTLKFSRENYFT